MSGDTASAKRSRESEDNAEHRPVKRPSYDYNDTASVLVSLARKCFTVHKGVLCNKSKFFRAACSERWKERQEKVVCLPEVETMVFQRYVDWVYGDILVHGEDMDENMRELVKLYLLGDKLEDVKLRNKAIKGLGSYCYIDRQLPGPESIELIWRSSTPSSPLRKWIIDSMMIRYSREAVKEHLTEWPAELMQQIAWKFMQQTPTQSDKAFQAKLPEYLEAEDSDRWLQQGSMADL